MPDRFPLPDYLAQIHAALEKQTRMILGLHSGTSADGPTGAVARVTGAGETARLDLVAHRTFPYPRALRELVLAVMEQRTGSVDRVCQADVAVGVFFAEIAAELVSEAGLTMDDIDLVASSGQVTYQVIPGQRPEHSWEGLPQYMAMLDLGDGGTIASQTGKLTLSGLRRKDNAVGGFGAPLVPFGDWVNFRHPTKDRVVWNIGGICNATIIPAGAPYDAVWAFDAGPGNMVIDWIAVEASSGRLTYDEDGRIAASGQVSPELLAHGLRAEFINQDPPKAAARQLFGDRFATEFKRVGQGLGLASADLVATATALTAEVIARHQSRYIDPKCRAAELVFSGGGALNPVLMQMIAERVAPTPVVTSDAFGVPVDCREVFAMILIANETLHGRPSNCPLATGAARATCLGHIDIPA
jgi:anhydro-N-acetylmuramic acid kinase